MKILIKNGRVIDPINGVDSILNIVTDNGKICYVGKDELSSDKVIDATGKIVSPGFIDIHMHEEGFDDTGKLKNSILLSMLNMGVTTAIGGNCGDNYADPIEYLDYIDKNGSPINMGLYAGESYFREKAGHKDKYTKVTNDELEKEVSLIDEALKKGLIGVSFGIRYIPGLDEKEMLACANTCISSHKLIAAHVRNDADYIIESIEEFANIARKLNIPIQVSHLGSMGGFGQMRDVLNLIDTYKANNMEIDCDCYPYYAFSTRIGATTYDDGWLERYHCDYNDLLICDGKYKGKRATKEIFDELRENAPETITVCYVMKKEDVDMAMLHNDVMLASDGLFDNGKGHPRAAGTFPRYINNYVKTNKISLYDAINKMTSLQAKKLGLNNKGRLNVGADADIVVFDLEKIKDNATFSEPSIKPSGIDYVIIAGDVAVENGNIINTHLGKTIRKYYVK